MATAHLDLGLIWPLNNMPCAICWSKLRFSGMGVVKDLVGLLDANPTLSQFTLSPKAFKLLESKLAGPVIV